MNTQTTQNTQQTAMGAAIQSANAQHVAALNAAPTNILAPTAANLSKRGVPMIVPRVDLLGNKILVLADSLNTEADTVSYYDLKKGSKPSTVSAAYYRSTKKIEDKQDVLKLVQDFSKATGNKEVILRERLVKETAAKRDEVGGVGADDLNAWKAKLKAALIKVVDEM